MRITGLATGLDVDEIVKSSMQGYRIKIDRKAQQKEILEIKQKLYREVIEDSRKFYNEYFDVTKSDSLLLTKNWSTTKFTSSNENILTVTGSSSAKAGNYTITGNIAKASSQTLTDIGDKIIINGQSFDIEGETNKEKAKHLNDKLSDAGVKVSVTYTDFAGTVDSENLQGFIFESTVLGEDSNFVIGGEVSDNKIVNGKNAKGAEITGISISKIKDSSNLNVDTNLLEFKFKINEEEISVNYSESSTNEEIKNTLNKAILEKGYKVEIDDSNDIKLISTKLGEGQEEPVIEIIDSEGNTEAIQIEFTDGESATSAEMILEDSDLNNSTVVINGASIDLSKLNLSDLSEDEANEKRVDYINKILKEQNINIEAEIENGNIVLKSSLTGENSNINFSSIEGGSVSTGGKYADILIKNDKGGAYKLEGTSNTVTLDGITFEFNSEIPENQTLNINGKQDVTEIKDKLVNFFNSYNTVIEKYNALISEKRDRDFDPLTDEQKEEMSEDEIKLWNEKVTEGQLSRDNDLTRISNSLKQAMRTLVDGADLNLEEIGITPVSDYSGTKNGTFTIDESKLTEALEENSEGIMNLFIKSKPKDDNLSNGQKYSSSGIMQRIKETLYNETVTVTSALLKKAGLEGTSTSYNNTITKAIEDYEKKMEEMEDEFARKEQLLYTKYANLETIMNNYNSQQSYLTQQLGLG